MCWIKNNTTIVRVAAILSLIQSLIWIAVSIVGIQLNRCKITVAGDGGGPYLIYLVYFFNVDCATAPDFLKILEPGWPLEPVYSSERTRILFTLVLTFNLLWVLTSLALLVSTFQIPFIRRIQKFFYFFGWILTTIVILILDLVGFSLLAYDFYKTSSPDGLLRLLGVTELIENWETYMPSRYYNAPAIPTAVVLPVVSRLFPILWIIDLVLLIRVVKAARKHEVTYREAFARVSRFESNPLYRESRWKDDGNNLQLGSSQVPQEEEQQMQQLNNDQENRATHLDRQGPVYAILEQEEEEEEQGQSQRQQPKEENKNHMREYEEINVANSNADFRYDDIDDDDTRIYEPPMQTSSPQPVRASLLKRISSQSKAPQGLQNQLPWSYLGRPSSNDEHPLASQTNSLKTDEDLTEKKTKE